MSREKLCTPHPSPSVPDSSRNKQPTSKWPHQSASPQANAAKITSPAQQSTSPYRRNVATKMPIFSLRWRKLWDWCEISRRGRPGRAADSSVPGAASGSALGLTAEIAGPSVFSMFQGKCGAPPPQQSQVPRGHRPPTTVNRGLVLGGIDIEEIDREMTGRSLASMLPSTGRGAGGHDQPASADGASRSRPDNGTLEGKDQAQ